MGKKSMGRALGDENIRRAFFLLLFFLAFLDMGGLIARLRIFFPLLFFPLFFSIHHKLVTTTAAAAAAAVLLLLQLLSYISSSYGALILSWDFYFLINIFLVTGLVVVGGGGGSSGCLYSIRALYNLQRLLRYSTALVRATRRAGYCTQTGGRWE